MPKLKRPSLKMRKFAKAYIENGGNASKAVRESYNTKSVKNSTILATRLMDNPMVQQTIKEYMDKAGLNPERLTDKLAKAMEDNLTNGKYSQAVGADLLKFSFKLQDLVPTSRSASVSYSRREIIHKTFDEVKEELQSINVKASKLIEDID